MVKYLGIQQLNEVLPMRRHALICLNLFSIEVCAKLLKQYFELISRECSVHRKAMDQQFNNNFCFKLGKTAMETHEMLV